MFTIALVISLPRNIVHWHCFVEAPCSEME